MEYKVGDMVYTNYFKGYNEPRLEVVPGIVVSVYEEGLLLELDKTHGNTAKLYLGDYTKAFGFGDFKEDKGYWQIYNGCITSIQVKATRLAKKLYPKATERDGMLIIPC